MKKVQFSQSANEWQRDLYTLQSEPVAEAAERPAEVIDFSNGR